MLGKLELVAPGVRPARRAICPHRAARAVLEELRSAGETITDLAGRLGEDPAWLQRKLHGQTPADLGDVMAWLASLANQLDLSLEEAAGRYVTDPPD